MQYKWRKIKYGCGSCEIINNFHIKGVHNVDKYMSTCAHFSHKRGLYLYEYKYKKSGYCSGYRYVDY